MGRAPTFARAGWFFAFSDFIEVVLEWACLVGVICSHFSLKVISHGLGKEGLFFVMELIFIEFFGIIMLFSFHHFYAL